jgi:hypothetical protein
MLVLYDPASDCVTAATPSWSRRLGVRLTAGRLDRALAGGASPDSTVSLALRAQALVRPAERLALADSLERILAATPCRSARAPKYIDAAFYCRVSAASAELRELVGTLRGWGPVSAEGMAKARLLVTDGLGPLHRGSGDLALAAREAIWALQATPSWA